MLKTQPMVGIGIPFLIASFVASFFLPNQIWVWIIVIAIVSILFGVFYKNKHAISVVVTLIACLCAFLSYNLKMRNEVEQITPLANQEVQITGTITDDFINDKGTYGYDLTVTDCSQNAPHKFKTILYSAVPIEADLYDQVTLKVLFNEITSTSSFDSKEYYQQDEIYVTAFLKEEILVEKVAKKPLMYGIKKLNKKLCHQIDLFLAGDEAGLVKAMLLGDRSSIGLLTMRSYSHSGMVHIISISGLHISILAVIFLWILGRLKLSYVWCLIVTIAIVWGFVALTNFNVSTIRAGFMLTVLLCGNIFGRPARSINSLFLSGILIVVVNPFAIRDIGFMMTFLATLGIITCAGKFNNYFIIKWDIQNRFILFLVRSVVCTISATIFLIPIYIMQFGGISTVAAIANLVAIPLTPIILVLGIVLLMISFATVLLPFANAVAELLSFAIKILTRSAELLADLPFAYIGIDYEFITLWFVISSIVLMIVIWKAKKYLFQFALCSISLLFAMALGSQIITRNDVTITTINTYQAQALVMTYRGRATIIETKSDNYINQSVANYLDRKNVRFIEDFIVLENQTKSVRDFAFLSTVKEIDTIYVDADNQIYEYCKNNLDYTSIIREFQQKQHGETIGNVKFKIVEDGENRTVWLNVYNRLICITSEREVSETAKCEFLYFTAEKVQQTENFSSKYVIILNKTNQDISNNRDKIFHAYDNRYTLKIKQNGSYQLEQE